MADKAISDLTEALQILSSDWFVLQQGNEAKKLNGNTLKQYLAQIEVNSIESVTFDTQGRCHIVLTDGTEIISQSLKGADGDTGPQGPQGVQGPPGEDGADGDDGIIESATAPTDTTRFWRDTTESKLKYYDAEAEEWKAVGSGGGGDLPLSVADGKLCITFEEEA